MHQKMSFSRNENKKTFEEGSFLEYVMIQEWRINKMFPNEIAK